MIIVKIQDLPKVGGPIHGSEYARVCDSDEITYLNETGYKIRFIDEPDYASSQIYCKGWDCPPEDISSQPGETECGVSYGPNNPRNLIRLRYDSTTYFSTPCKNYENAYKVNQPGEKGYVIGCPNGLELYTPPITTSMLIPKSTSFVTIEATTISEQKTTTLEANSEVQINPTSSKDNFSSSIIIETESPITQPEVSSQWTQQSNTIVHLSKASAQLSAGAVIGIVFASIAGFTLFVVIIGIVGFLFFNLSTKKSDPQEYTFSNSQDFLEFE